MIWNNPIHPKSLLFVIFWCPVFGMGKASLKFSKYVSDNKY